jgi:hypothetical protein
MFGKDLQSIKIIKSLRDNTDLSISVIFKGVVIGSTKEKSITKSNKQYQSKNENSLSLHGHSPAFCK